MSWHHDTAQTVTPLDGWPGKFGNAVAVGAEPPGLPVQWHPDEDPRWDDAPPRRERPIVIRTRHGVYRARCRACSWSTWADNRTFSFPEYTLGYLADIAVAHLAQVHAL